MLKKTPDLVSEIVKQRDNETGKTIQTIDQQKNIYIYKHQYSVNGHSLDAVLWSNGCITLAESYNDVISFSFGGCVMANFIMNFRLYTAHIHNADMNHPNEDARMNWMQYVKSNNIDIQSMFRPGNESFDILNKINSEVKIWGVCTSLGKKYSLILNEKEDHLISIREYVTPFDYSDILKPRTNDNYCEVRRRWNNFWNAKQHYKPIYKNYIPKSLINR